MRKLTPIFFSTLLIILSVSARAQFIGGNNDGGATALSCAINLDGAAAFSLSAISGSSEFCNFSTQTYSVVVTGGTQNQTFLWSVPAGASVLSGQGTSSVLIQFGNTAGNVRVDVTNDCSSQFSALPVTSGSCVFFQGGSNDGFSRTEDCASNLNGGSVFIPDPIVGSTTFCDFATETYSILVAGSTIETTYLWSVPAGATITSGQGTNSILVTFGNTAGNVSVDVSNPCETINVALPVSATSCLFYAGGDNDGATVTTDCASNLNGGSTFIPGPIVGSASFCDFASETYSIAVAGATIETTYNWTVPPGAVITSGQGTTEILVAFGNTAGNISVDVSNPCETINVALPVSTTACIFYAGGDNDGFSNTTDCASNLNGGSTFVPGPIVGSTAFCDFASETYSITVAGATSETTYLWSAPPGATITSGQGTTSVLVTFGNTAGNVSVAVSNPCETINVPLAVSSTACIFYAGGINDGFAQDQTCISSLNGTSGFIPGPIVGSTTFCDFATESYTITVAGATASTVYSWSVPAGATITSGQGTNTILVTFGNTAGNVSVNISNECETVPASLAVSPTSCIFYAGGNSDGFAYTLTFNIPLPIELVSFEGSVLNGVVHLKWTTASELNNDFFTLERSRNGEKFEAVETIPGAGTSVVSRTYHAEDKFPFIGKSYYRLKQTDYDGKTSISNIILVEVLDRSSGVVALYPNPIENNSTLTVVYIGNETEEIVVNVTDVSGRVIHRKPVSILEGENFIQLQTEFQANGIYLVEVIGKSGRQVFRLVVN
ncbi:MAG: T9SS type A sorting domain-containing protein [Cyclobacteriaceae bacterium]